MSEYVKSLDSGVDGFVLRYQWPAKLQGIIPFSCKKSGFLLAAADLFFVFALNAAIEMTFPAITTAQLAALHSESLVASLMAVLYCLFMEVQDQYSCAKYDCEGRIGVRPVLAWLAAFATLMGLVFFAKVGAEVSRLTTLVLLGVGVVVLPLWRGVMLRLVKAMLDCNLFAASKRAIVLSFPGAITESRRQIHALQRHGRFIVSHAEIDYLNEASFNCFKPLFAKERIDEVFLACSLDAIALPDAILALKNLPLPVFWLGDESASALMSKPHEVVGALRALKVQGGPLTPSQQLSKRVLDVCLSFAGIVLLLPLFVFIAVAIKMDSGGPIIFNQRRSGFNGRTFRIYKFRSMTTTDDGVRIEQATRDDRRITRIGRVLRKSSLDELPQLFNVLKGEMSLVGPRPHALSHDDQYGELIASYALRYHVKPGITGWAQVNGCRGETKTVADMERRVDLDLWYIKNWSVWIDVKAIFGTLRQLTGSPNAY